MIAVPHDVPLNAEDRITGLVCPDCYGVLQVKRTGPRGRLEFTCRIGHAYGLQELLAAKEDDLERRAWSAVEAGEELHALLRDLVEGGFVSDDMAGRIRARGEAAQRMAEAWRALIAADRTVKLETDDGPGSRFTRERS